MWHFLNLHLYLIQLEFSPWQVLSSCHHPLHSPSAGFYKPHVLILMGASDPSLNRVLPRSQPELSEKDYQPAPLRPLTYHRRPPAENKANTEEGGGRETTWEEQLDPARPKG